MINLSTLNPQQRIAVENTEGPLLVLAGAGSGKTRVLTYRVAHLMEKGVPAWKILAITFTNKAAKEMAERVQALTGEAGSEAWISTFHACCARILRRDIEKLGYKRQFAIYDEDDRMSVIKAVLKELNLGDKEYPPKAVKAAISDAKNRMLSPDEWLRDAGDDFRNRKYYEAYRLYERTLRGNNALDFDDLLVKTLELLAEQPPVLEYYQNRFDYILVDEYQDTNRAQYELVRLLTGKKRNLCVVGDDDQSIYKFRGATIENILSFERQFPGAKVVRLEQNYRSTQNILSAANKVIEHNLERKGKTLWTANGDGSKITVRRCVDEDSEASFVADKVLDGVSVGKKYSDFAVLYRMHAQSNSIEHAFTRAGIPYKIIGGLRFYERKEIKDLLAYMSVITNPADNLRLVRIINEPKRGIGDTTVAAAERLSDATGLSLFEIFEHADEYADLSRRSSVLMHFTDTIKSLAEEAESFDAESFFDSLCEKTGYLDMLRAQGAEGEGRIENIGELKTNLMKYEEAAEQPELAGFLEEVALYTDLDRMEETDSVLMMTLHSAKGLEFPSVFVVGMEEGVFPGMQAIYDMNEMEEERRLAYVGMTRAKRNLYLTAAASRMIFGQTNHNRISRFIEEIPDEYKEFFDETERRRQNVSYHFEEAPSGRIRTEKTFSAAPQKAQGTVFGVGDRVRHKVFGGGTVLAASPMAGDTMLEIAFDTKGTKKLMANFAKLTKE